MTVLDDSLAPPPWALPDADGEGRPHPGRLGALFAYGARNLPDKTAIADSRSRYSFAELEAMARRLAEWLRRAGVRRGDRVAVIAEKRSMVPAVATAIWKLDAVYVPLDGDAPPARLDRMLRRLNPGAIIDSRTEAREVRDGWLGGAALSVALQEGPVPEDPTPEAPVDDEHPAYIIFTSGSTGEPKGVEIAVGSLLAYFAAHNEMLRVTPDSRVFSLSPFHFDVSIEDTLLPLSLGAYVYQFNGIVAGALICKVLRREAITHLIAVSTVLTLITDAAGEITRERFPALQMVMTGAEVCAPKIINRWKAGLPDVRVINVYGPTEATIVCAGYTIERPEPERVDSFPIGRPLTGVRARVAAADGTPVADGEVGELWIGGPQVMRGYFDQPDETARAVRHRDGVRYYRTGDIVRAQPDGNLVFVGRSDDEVKLAGRRIHLGEVRQRVLALPEIDRVAVGTLERAGRREIAVVVIAADPGAVERAKAHLAKELPGYMRPTVWCHSSKVELSGTGKTDEKKILRRLCEVAADSRQVRFRFTADGRIEEQHGGQG